MQEVLCTIMNREDQDYMERHYHLSWGRDWVRSPRYGIPVLLPETGRPRCVVPFDKMNVDIPAGACLQFHLADRRIDCIWTNTEKYVDRISKFDFVTCPDFSLLLEMGRAEILWNVQRSFKLGRYFQSLGMHVFSTAMWAYPDTYDICFEPVPRHSVSFVSTIGSNRKEESRKQFKLGLRAFCERTMPAGLILYGPMPALDFDIPVLCHFDRVSPAQFGAYQPDLI